MMNGLETLRGVGLVDPDRKLTPRRTTMPESNEEQPKIIVDSDWKAEAQKEKEEAERMTREEPGQKELPPPSLAEVIQMILVQASIGLGGFQDPQTGQRIPPNMPLAQHYIDLLGLLQEKTQGNLDEQEKQLIDGALHELRLAFVQMVNTAAQAGAAKEKPEG
jgi:hypothetical protein